MFTIFKKELQSHFTSPWAYVVIAFFVATFSLTFIMEIGNVTDSTYEFSFASIFYTNLFYFVLFLPLLTFCSFTLERKNGTETLLLSSPVSTTKIVLGKFFATALIVLIMMAFTLIFPIVTAMFGKVIWPSMICTFIGFYLYALVCIAIGIFVSTLTESILISILISEGVMLLLLLMDNLAANSFLSSIPILSDFLNFFANQEKFYIFSQGLIRISDIVGYVTEIITFVAWSVISVEKRRWARR